MQKNRRIRGRYTQADFAENKKVEYTYCRFRDMMSPSKEWHERGVHVPADVKVIGFDDVSIATFSSKPITTIRQNAEEMGELAVELLLRRIEGEKIEAPHRILGVELISRATT